MLTIFIMLSRYFFVLAGFYFLYSSIKLALAIKSDEEFEISYYFNAQKINIILFHFVGFLILVLTRENQLDLLILYIEQVLLFLILWFIVYKFHYGTHLLLWNIALFLSTIGYIVLTRLNYGYGVRQFRISLIGFAIALIIPKIFSKLKFLSKLQWVYLIMSFALLFIVNDTINGSKNWVTIGSFGFQPSEFVKITYILFLASFFRKGCNRMKFIASGIFTALLVFVLVFQKDLGGALIFSILYLTLLYIETCNPIVFLGGLSAGSLAAFVGYKIFDHVKIRVQAWANPWADIDNRGYQITQSLFAIGAGGWFGIGLTKGIPNKIPVVMTDFIFAAISEEFGNLFAIFLILILIVLFYNAMNMSVQVEDHFSFLVAAGISIILAFQQFLIIGGVIKFIPSTGVTLPFISYGGTSFIASCIMIGLLQGVYLNRRQVDEEEKDEE